MPQKIRDTLQLCRFFDADLGIRSILDRIDWAAATLPSQVYSAVLDRLPETKSVAVAGFGYSVRDRFEDALASREFQENLIDLIASAFPEKRRLIFVHIPRTAGTDLESNLEKRYPHVHHKVTVPEDIPSVALFSHLKMFSQNIGLSNDIFISGHIELRWHRDHRICRFGDHVFTIVRDPIDMLVSWVNYVATVLLDSTNPNRPDRKNWLRILGMDLIPDSPDDGYCVSLATNVLRSEAIVGHTMICRYLGAGTAQSALEMLAICGVEITSTEFYAKWLQHTWNIDTTTQKMQSTKILSKHSLSRPDYDYLYERSREDQILYRRIMEALGTSGSLSINGLDIAG